MKCGYNLNMKLTDNEIDAYRKGQHTVEARSMSAFVRECVRQRLVELELVKEASGRGKSLR